MNKRGKRGRSSFSRSSFSRVIATERQRPHSFSKLQRVSGHTSKKRGRSSLQANGTKKGRRDEKGAQLFIRKNRELVECLPNIDLPHLNPRDKLFAWHEMTLPDARRAVRYAFLPVGWRWFAIPSTSRFRLIDFPPKSWPRELAGDSEASFSRPGRWSGT